MIARIMTENQYRLTDEDATALDQMDDPLHEAIKSGDERVFAAELEKVVAFVREKGTVIPVEEVVPSDVIIPAPDMTVTEARQYLQKGDEAVAAESASAGDATE